MNAVGVKIRGSLKKGTNYTYPCRLNLYLECTTPEIGIDDFEKFALNRLLVLKAIETAQIRNKRDEEFRTHVKKVEDQYLPLHANKYAMSSELNLDEERSRDIISHFILRLAYCRSEDLRKWLLNQEVALFKFRLESETLDDLDLFMKENKLSYTLVSEEEKDKLSANLMAAGGFKEINTMDFFKVPFEEAIELIKDRKVYLLNGIAYVPKSLLSPIIAGIFRSNLSKSLIVTSKILPRLEEDDRLMPILNNMAHQHALSSTYAPKNPNSGTVTADDIDSLVQHFPLCMKHLHNRLQENHHLKHGGRLQYGLFLKAIGMSLEESLIFWRRAFHPTFSDDQFNKKYSYGVRHSYGQEGKRADYPPYSCVKIITSNAPGPGDHHGCPFRHFSADNLKASLSSQGVPSSGIQEIIDLVNGHHYQIACTRHFELTHKTQGQIDTIDHPNQYFDLSLKSMNISK